MQDIICLSLKPTVVNHSTAVLKSDYLYEKEIEVQQVSGLETAQGHHRLDDQ